MFDKPFEPMENTPEHLKKDPRYAMDKKIRDVAWAKMRRAGFPPEMQRLIDQGYAQHIHTGDARVASLFTRAVVFALNPEGSTAKPGALRKSGGHNIDGYSEDAFPANGDPNDLFNVYDIVVGVGLPGAYPAWQGPLPRRSSDMWEKPRQLTEPELGVLGVGAVVSPSPPIGDFWDERHTSVHRQLLQHGFADTRKIAEQFAFSFPNERWGQKSADGQRPVSVDVIARWVDALLIGYRVLPQLLTNGINLSGQMFRPVSPVDYLNTGEPAPDKPPPGLICPDPTAHEPLPPTDPLKNFHDNDLLAIAEEFVNRGRRDDAGGMVDAGSQFGRRIQARYSREKALEETRGWIEEWYGPRRT